MSHKRKKLDYLIFPDQNTWVQKWLTDAILATPKWQINSLMGAYYFNEWIDILASRLNGMRLPERVDPTDNWVRSMAVGFGVALASREYERNKIKVEMQTENQFIKDILNAPTVKMAIGQSTLAPKIKEVSVTTPRKEERALAVTA